MSAIALAPASAIVRAAAPHQHREGERPGPRVGVAGRRQRAIHLSLLSIKMRCLKPRRIQAATGWKLSWLNSTADQRVPHHSHRGKSEWCMGSGSRRRTGLARLASSRSRPRVGCRSWSRSVTAEYWCRRSPFYRCAAYLMASDLAEAPRTGLSVQLCGDAHLSNFGVFAAPDRRLVFSVNDFDQTLPGPFESDVKRLVASFAVAGTDRGFDTKQRKVDQPGYGPVLSEAMLDLADEKARCLVCPPRHRGDRRSAEGAGEEGPGEAVRAERGQSPDGSSQCRFASASISRVAPRTRSSPR
jgi:Uncharacterized protein conserved in bacteria (DUF2252)